MSKWKETVELYHLIQQKCDRPAFFWYNWNKDSATCANLIYAGYGGGLMDAIKRDYLNPQQFCNDHL